MLLPYVSMSFPQLLLLSCGKPLIFVILSLINSELNVLVFSKRFPQCCIKPLLICGISVNKGVIICGEFMLEMVEKLGHLNVRFCSDVSERSITRSERNYKTFDVKLHM